MSVKKLLVSVEDYPQLLDVTICVGHVANFIEYRVRRDNKVTAIATVLGEHQAFVIEILKNGGATIQRRLPDEEVLEAASPEDYWELVYEGQTPPWRAELDP